LGERLCLLPESALAAEGRIPEMPGWRWIATPGHSPGHVSLFRDDDRALLAGDAFETANMDSWTEAITKPVHLWRGGTPFTCDWERSFESVQILAELDPSLLAAGHGRPVSGARAGELLRELADDFPIPEHGRYVKSPAEVDERGVVALPPRPADPVKTGAAIAGVALAGFVAHKLLTHGSESPFGVRTDSSDDWAGAESYRPPEERGERYVSRSFRGAEIYVPPT
jgi:glyoxylase-like metal-dependent hydrolase (beta-lactamase superfamily II)